MLNAFLDGANLPVVIESLTVLGVLLAVAAVVTAVLGTRNALRQPTLMSAWKRGRMAMAIIACLAGVLLLDAWYLTQWKSSQLALYNFGIQLYTAGDTPCEQEQLSDPVGNKCVDLQKDIKVFHASWQMYLATKDDADFVQRKLLPAPSQWAAAEAALHEANLWLLAQKTDEAIKAYKISIMLSESADPTATMTKEQKDEMLKHPTPEYLNFLRLQDVQIRAQYDLELLFKKNPSAAQGEGKGKPKPGQQGNKNGPSTQDQQPDPTAGKGNRQAI